MELLMYVYCKDCGGKFDIEVRPEELNRGVPRGIECPYCKSRDLVEDR